MSSAARNNPWTIAPHFIVDDVVKSANFYRDKLGFHSVVSSSTVSLIPVA